jgi:CHAT domain-containing protein
MMIKQPKPPEIIDQHGKLAKSFHKLVVLVDELNKKEIPADMQEQINLEIDTIGKFEENPDEQTKTVKKVYQKLLNLIRKQLGIVPEKYYQNIWMVLGLTVFGVPLGILYAAATSNPGLFTIGIAMGLPIGLAIGIQMDKKAARENKQIQIG